MENKISLFGFHLYPTLTVLATLVPGLVAMSSADEISVLDVVGFLISFFGFVIQAIADYQLEVFRKKVKFNRTEILKSGLFFYVRHPNYCGEMLMWIGLGIIGFGVTKNYYFLSGIVLIVSLFVFYSGPAMDERLKNSRGKNFSIYAAKTPSFIPSF